MKKACVTLPRHLTPAHVQISDTVLSSLVAHLWEEAGEVLRYQLDDTSCLTRAVPGDRGFCVSYNQHRFKKKRKSQSVSSTRQPFDEHSFNFNKLKQSEILVEVAVSEETDSVNVSMSRDTGTSPSLISVNDSPLSPAHVLLLPAPAQQHNQMLTADAIELGLSYLICSGNPDLRVVFNSLRAFASVNHLHLHAYLIGQALPVESAAVQHVVECCYTLAEYPVPGFLLQFHSHTPHFTESIYKVIALLQELDIPHNMIMTYGDPCQDSTAGRSEPSSTPASREPSSTPASREPSSTPASREPSSTPASREPSSTPASSEPSSTAGRSEPSSTPPDPVIRVCVFPVLPSDTLSEDMLFRPAVCELSGHILVDDKAVYDTITEEDIIKTVQCVAIPDLQFSDLVSKVRELLS